MKWLGGRVQAKKSVTRELSRMWMTFMDINLTWNGGQLASTFTESPRHFLLNICILFSYLYIKLSGFLCTKWFKEHSVKKFST